MLSLALCLLCAVASPEAEIRAVIDKQAADWNRGDVEAFMKGYEDSPDITYVGRKGVTRGYRAIAENYRRNYSSRDAMGTLRFSEMEVRLLGSEAALVLGRFDLDRRAEAGGPASGRFTLVFRRTSQGWKIIHDHTS